MIGLAENPSHIFEFKGLMCKILCSKDLRVGSVSSLQ
jgi:hypothetical protein